MNYYLNLQYQRLLRTSSENGSNFHFGLLIIISLFSAGSIALFHYLDWAAVIYLIVQLILLNAVGNPRHNSILNHLFDRKTHFQIRIIENFVFSLPFIVFFAIYNQIPYLLLSLSATIVLSGSKGISWSSRPIPTPFPKKPFEFTSGFRLNWLIFALIFCVSIISISVDNVNLGIVCVFLSNLICTRVYAKHEPEEILWLSNTGPSAFLMQKMKLGALQSLVLTLPFAIVLTVFYPEMFHIILIAEALGLLYIVTSLFAKYAFYPDENSLTGGFLLAFSVLLPPALMITIPYLYRTAKSNLQSLLK